MLQNELRNDAVNNYSGFTVKESKDFMVEKNSKVYKSCRLYFVINFADSNLIGFQKPMRFSLL